MSFKVTTNSQYVFSPSGSYYAWATLSYVNNGNRTFTVSVDSVSATCNYGWNFGSYITISLGGLSKSVKINSSGSNTYKGTLSTSVGFKQTFSYNDNGSVPAISFSISSSNPGVYDIKTGNTTKVSVSGSANISSYISSIGAKDISPPSISVQITDIVSDFAGGFKVNWKATSSSTISYWEYRLTSSSGSQTNWTRYTTGGTISTGTASGVNIDGTYSLQIRAVKSSNGVSGTSNTITFNGKPPQIRDSAIEILSPTTGKLHFKTDSKCDYKLTNNDGYDSGWITGLAANTDPNKEIKLSSNVEKTYTLYVAERIYTSNTNYFNGISSKVNIIADTRLPNIKELYFTPNSISDGNLTISSDYNYQWRYMLNGSWSSWSDTIHANIKDNRRIDNLSNNLHSIKVEVRRSESNTLISSKTLEVDMRLPNIKSPIVTITQNGLANIKFTSSYDFSYRYYVNGNWSSWTNNIAANSQINTNVSVAKDFLSTVTLQLKRSTSDKLLATLDLIADSRLPHISNAALTLISTNSANLRYICDFKTKYYITTTTTINGEVNAGTTLSYNIPILENKLTNYKLTVIRADNLNLRNEYTFDIDNRKPATSSLYIETTSVNTGLLQINPLYDTYVYIGNNSVVDCKANQNTSIELELQKNKNSFIEVKLCRKLDIGVASDILVSQIKIPYDTLLPLVFDQVLTVTSSNTANIQLYSDHVVSIKFSCDGFEGKWLGKGDYLNIDANIKNDSIENYSIHVRREDIPCLQSTLVKRIDSRLPIIENCKLFNRTTDGSLAGLIGDFELPLNFDFTGTTSVRNCNIANGLQQIAPQNLPVYPDEFREYDIRFYRVDNHRLFVDKKIICDTRLPKIEFIKFIDGRYIYTAGSAIKLKYRNISKDNVIIDDSYITLKLDDEEKIRKNIGTITSSNIFETKIPEDDKDTQLIPGENYSVTITATRNVYPELGVNSELRHTTNTLNFEATNGVWLKFFDNYIPSTVCIYDGSRWREAIPYIYSAGKWVRTK